MVESPILKECENQRWKKNSSSFWISISPKNHPLNKIDNRNTVKMSYRTTPNFKKIIAAHNSKILNKKTPDPPATAWIRTPVPWMAAVGQKILYTKQLLQLRKTPQWKLMLALQQLNSRTDTGITKPLSTTRPIQIQQPLVPKHGN